MISFLYELNIKSFVFITYCLYCQYQQFQMYNEITYIYQISHVINDFFSNWNLEICNLITSIDTLLFLFQNLA